MAYFVIDRGGTLHHSFILESLARTTAAKTARLKGLRSQDVIYVEAGDEKEARRIAAIRFRKR